MADSKKPFHEVVAEKLIEQLKAGTAPWQKPWEPGAPNSFLPMNPTTGKRYKGINAIHLMAQGRTDSRWMTYKQAAAAGAQVRKGEKGTPVQYWKFSEEQDKVDDNGRPVLDGQGKTVKETVMLERPRVFFATVFNGEQIDGLPPIQRKEQAWDAVERAEHILQASGANIRHGENNRAFYRPATDSIHLPDKGQFPTADRYYATALHELGHWTGHESRLDRDLSHPFGSEGYAKEELRAEISSMILGDELGIGHDPEQHAAYVGSWIKALEDDPLEIFRASAEAEKIHDYVLAFEQKQVQEQGQQQAADQRPPHEMTLAEFIAQANTEELTNHGRKWNVTLGDRYAAFSDADSPQAALADVHRATVNNALYLNTPEAAGIGSRPTLPPAAVLAEYPDLVAQYPQATEQEAKMQTPSRSSDPFSDENFAAQVGVNRAPSRSAEAAEAWVLKHVQDGTLGRALHDGTTLEQIDRVGDVIDRMQPLNTQNDFWARHELPQDVDGLDAKVEYAAELIEQRRPDVVVAAAFRDLKAGNGNAEAFDQAADDALGFALPRDWTGEVRIIGVVERDGQTVEAALADGPQAYHLYARKGEAQPGEDAFAYLTATPELAEADALADRLALIDANSEVHEQDKAAKLARVQEERVRRDPNSTDEDISAAKEVRKTADAASLAAEVERQQRTPLESLPGHTMAYNDRPGMAGVEVFTPSGEIIAFGGRPALEQFAAENQLSQRDLTALRALDAQADKYRSQPQYADQQATQSSGRNYINVPFKEKNEAKQLGARWDRQEQSWYVPPGVDAAPFAKWAQGATTAPTAAAEGHQEARPTETTTQGQKTAQERVYLAVPYGERAAAKAAGAQWDKAAKSWYAGPNADMTRLERWKPENVPGQQGPAMTPKEEFADAMRSLGCIVSGEHPIMDGKRHRITVEGDKKGEQAGFYVGHLDGHPAGYIKNNRTGLDMKWKSKGYTLDPEEKAKLQAEAATKLADRAAEQERLHEATAQRVGRQAENLLPVTEPTPYMQAKGIEAHAGLLTDKDGQKTYIPAFDVDGKQWTMQYIQEDGTKRFAKDSRKEGCFHPVGGMDAVAAAPALVIAEGYATAATLAGELGQATVAAFDSGNLPAVARALHEKFPDKPVIIAGDDDRHQVITQGTNPGRTKAEEAAKAVGGMAIFPIFAPGENSYPSNLPPITPQNYREHERALHRLEAAQKEPEKVQITEQETAELKRALLSPEQLAGLAGMKAHTDFNDLATRSELGREGVERQAKAAVSQALQAQEQRQEQKQKLEQEQKQEQKQEQRPRRAMKV
nr:hypothetical protein [uncultured bacterium]